MAPALTAATAVAMLPYPVSITIRAPGRAWRSALTTSKPRPSPRRMSTTAKAGICSLAAATPAATLSAVVTINPRRFMARASRWHNGASSSTISSVRSDSGRRCSSPAKASAPGRFSRSLVSMVLPLTLSTDRLLSRKGDRDGYTGAGFLHHLQIGTFPENRNMRAAFRKVLESQPRATALEQALRDEYPEPHMVGRPGARRDVRLAEAPQEMQREPGTVIGDFDDD